MLPSSLHVAQARLAAPDFGRLFLGHVAQLGQFRVAEQGVVVEAHLGVEREQLARAR